LNAANEVAVEAFLRGRISFKNIPEVIEKTMGRHFVIAYPELSDILEADVWARKIAEEQLG
jgi:1-deoxy-D-xylulose-5-phosphate reductoisomerase